MDSTWNDQNSQEFEEMENEEFESKDFNDDEFQNSQGFGEMKNEEFKKQEDELEVEHILMQRNNQGKIQYLIQWRGFDQSESTWEPEENLEGCQELLKSFHNQTKCFCGGPGYWYDRMLECQRCKVWFHEACITCLKYKLIPGDQFYCYVCEFCNEDKEFLHRLTLGWKEIAQLALFNLLHSKNVLPSFGSYFDYEDHITPWINRNWDSLQCPPGLQSIPKEKRSEHILKVLQGNKSKFKCGTEIRKKKSLFALKINTPPSVREILLPEDFPITEASMENISFTQRAIEILPVLKTFKVDFEAWASIPFHEIMKSKTAGRKRVRRDSRYFCGECEGCRTEHPCGECVACEDKPMFGGPGKSKQKCLKQICDKHHKKKNNRFSTFQNPYQHFMEGSSVSDSAIESDPLVRVENYRYYDPESFLEEEEEPEDDDDDDDTYGSRHRRSKKRKNPRRKPSKIPKREVECESVVVKCEPPFLGPEDDEQDTYPEGQDPLQGLYSGGNIGMKRLLSNFDSERFIIEVEQRPVLWDSRCNDSNKLSRGKAWEEICESFMPDFGEMDSVKKNTAVVDLQRKWRNFRDNFKKAYKKSKSGSRAEAGKKKYMYYNQLSFLLPTCETRPQEEGDSEDPADERSLEDDNQLSPSSPVQKNKNRKIPSEEELLFQTLAKQIERKAREKKPDDPDKYFLLSLLPYFKSLSENARLEVQVELLNTLKRYKQHPAYASQQFPPASNQYIPGHTSSVGPAEERNSDDEDQSPPPSPPTHQNRKNKTSASEEQLLFETLTKNIERKEKEKKVDESDKYFLLSLLPYFKSFPEYGKLEVQMEFLSTLKRYKQHAAFASQQFPPMPTHYFPGPASSMIPAPHSFPLPNGTGTPSTGHQQSPIPNIHNSYTNPQPSVSAGSSVLSQMQSI